MNNLTLKMTIQNTHIKICKLLAKEKFLMIQSPENLKDNSIVNVGKREADAYKIIM